jgi:hypothetical protein
MSNLKNNTTRLETILNTINELPAAGNGEEAVKTRTINITSPDDIKRVYATCYVDGHFEAFTKLYSSSSVTISDVVCNSMVVVRSSTSPSMIEYSDLLSTWSPATEAEAEFICAFCVNEI